MVSATQIVYATAGEPHIDSAEVVLGRCWLCGATMSRGVPWSKWQGALFTDQNKCAAPESSHVCTACVWCCAWNPPPGAPRPVPGKKGLNLRLFSHLYDEKGYVYANKKNKPLIRSWLRGPHVGQWFAAISDSGQKHMLPWVAVNPPGLSDGSGIVYFEERSLHLGDWNLVDDITDLLDKRVTKGEIGTGDWSFRTWRDRHDDIKTFDGRHGHLRGGSWFALALWLSQRG